MCKYPNLAIKSRFQSVCYTLCQKNDNKIDIRLDMYNAIDMYRLLKEM